MMKKIITIFLAILIIITNITANVSAETINDNHFDYLFFDRYIELYQSPEDMVSYTELFYHNAYESLTDDSVDWVLVRAYSYKDAFTNHLKYCTIIGDRVLIKSYSAAPFPMEYAIYDVNSDTFYDISEVDINSYNDLHECLVALEIGLPIGDVDYDGKLTIIDSTEIQRCIACISEFKESDIIKADIISKDNLKYISDFDRDGERTVLDATAIQMKLAKK